jgi:tetratricopeptide (TPR) repeat protein
VASIAEPIGPTQVFLSYAREDFDTAQAVAEALAADGHRVWWDRRLGGGMDFAAEIERQLAAARVAVVLWSAASVQSGFVRDESTRARDAGKLLPVRIGEVALPLGFGTLHTLDLIDWDGDGDDEACLALREEVRRQVTSTPREFMAQDAPRAPSLLRRCWRMPLAVAIGALLLAASAWWWFGNDGNAQAHFERGLAAHFDTEPNLEVARNAYLAALREQADFEPAHFYLAHVYALLQLPADARTHFTAALAHADQLDPAQKSDAQKQLQAVVALLAAPEPAPVKRDVANPPGDKPIAAAATPTASADPAAVAVPPPSTVVVPSSPTLVRTAPSETQQQVARTQASALLGRDRQAQVTAATTLALNATLSADALPQVVQSTLETLRAQPDSAAAREAVAQSLRLLQSASPSLLREHARAAQRIADAGKNFGGSSAAAAADVQTRLAGARALKPFAFVQIADERQRAIAQGVVVRLASMGYSAPGIENVGAARSPIRTEVRTQGASDPALARWMAQHLGKLTQSEVAVRTLRQAQPKTDTYEIWFEKDLCLTPARTVPACSGG